MFTDTMTLSELEELLTSLTITNLTSAVATSNAALCDERANILTLQSRLTASHKAVATVMRVVMDANCTIDRVKKDLASVNTAVREGQRKLADSEATISQLTAFGEHDRLRLLDKNDENRRLQK